MMVSFARSLTRKTTTASQDPLPIVCRRARAGNRALYACKPSCRWDCFGSRGRRSSSPAHHLPLTESLSLGASCQLLPSTPPPEHVAPHHLGHLYTTLLYHHPYRMAAHTIIEKCVDNLGACLYVSGYSLDARVVAPSGSS